MGEGNMTAILLEESIRDMLNTSREEGTKKQISLNIDEKTLQLTDAIADQFKQVTSGKLATSRNHIIEKALEEYLKAASAVLLNDYFINIEEHISSPKDQDVEDEDKSNSSKGIRDLAIFPAQNKGFEAIFLKKNQWYSVRVASWRIPNIRYVACYRGAPYSGITHYAEVKDFKKLLDGKYIINFTGPAISLPQTVKLGNTDVKEVRKLRYSSLDKLKNAFEVADLW
jgi:predicted DNA binding CopG/RHH family protein